MGVLDDNDGELIIVDRDKAKRISVYKVPVGSENFVKRYPDPKRDKIRQGVTKAAALLDPGI